MALAGSPSEEPIAVIYGASDGHGAVPLALTGLQRKHLQSVKVSKGAEGVEERVCARGQRDTGASTSCAQHRGMKAAGPARGHPDPAHCPSRASPFSTGAQRC